MTRGHRRAVLGVTAALYLGSMGLAWADALPVGVIMELTGSNALIGTQISKGVQLATDEINGSGYLGANTIKLILDDNASDKGQALTLLNRQALRDNVVVVLGPSLTPVMAAIAPRSAELQVPIITPALSPTAIEGSTWAFKSSDVPANLFIGMAKYTTDVIKPKTCVRVFARDNDGYVSQSNVWKDYVAQRGTAVSMDLSVTSSDTDFSAISTRIVGANPECVHLAMPPEPSANLIIQLRSAGLAPNTKILTGVAQANNLFLKAAGQAAEGVYVLAEYRPGGANEEGRAFEVAYRKKFNEGPDNYAAVGYALMKLTAHAMKTAGATPTRPAIREALANLKTFTTVIGGGTLTMENRMARYDTNVLIVKGGAFAPAP